MIRSKSKSRIRITDVRLDMSERLAIATLFCLLALAAGCSRADSSRPAESASSVLTRQSLPHSLVMGEQSCASAGCHGQAGDEETKGGPTRDWRTAYSVWFNEDPHRRAFAVLYTERAVEMYRNLNPEAKLSAEPPADIPYEAFLGERCLGCHATGLRGRGVVPLPEGRDRPAFYLAGVTCESCHGPASGWLNTHYLTGFSRDTPRNAPGFHDTKPLDSRSAACVGCHVGPMIAENGKTYDMNHDLVAAGHPRLAFEFASYLANLPKHWNEALDHERQHIAGQPARFHSDAWAVGQEQTARQLVRQIEHRLTAANRDSNTTPWPDFSNYDCFDCHHAIGPPGNGRTTSAQLAGRHNFPRPALAPLAMLRIMSGKSPPDENPQVARAAAVVEALLNDSWRMPVAEVSAQVNQPASGQLAILSARGPPPPAGIASQARQQQQAAWLLARMQSWKRPALGDPQRHRWDPTWDEALQLYLGVLALAQDIEQQSPGPLHNALAPLGESLDQHSFHRLGRPPTQYDSPADFDPASMRPTFDDIEAALINITKFDSGPSTP